jgi:hypothetical protein
LLPLALVGLRQFRLADRASLRRGHLRRQNDSVHAKLNPRHGHPGAQHFRVFVALNKAAIEVAGLDPTD